MVKLADETRNKLSLKENRIFDVNSTDFPGAHPGQSNHWDFDKFKKQLKINVIKIDDTDMEFDLIGVDAALANAFRRILLAEIPTMAIEKVHIHTNTSMIKDEILAHRLGLIPLKADASLFEYPLNDDDAQSSENTLVFKLQVKCTQRPDAPKGWSMERQLNNSKVLSGDIKWEPLGDQAHSLSDVRPIHSDILIAKMRKGHEIDVVMHAVKGIGKDHAKFSPVSTASYRLLPDIVLKRKIVGEQAHRLQKCFSPGVIDVRRNNDGEEEAKVVDARSDTCSREVFSHADLKDAVELGKIRDHFIFSIESATSKSAEQLFMESVKVLMSKCDVLLKELDESEQKIES